MGVDNNFNIENNSLSNEQLNEIKFKREKRKNIFLIIMNIILIIIIVILLLIKDDKICADLSVKEDVLEITPTEPSDNKIGEVIIYDKDIVWKKENELKIFENPLYDNESIIAPESSNTYKFIIKNDTDFDIESSLSFNELNPYEINMMYRLRTENGYIIGNENEWVRVEDLNIDKIAITKGKKETYYLEWKWFESDSDTKAGANGAEYSIYLTIISNQITE